MQGMRRLLRLLLELPDRLNGSAIASASLQRARGLHPSDYRQARNPMLK